MEFCIIFRDGSCGSFSLIFRFCAISISAVCKEREDASVTGLHRVHNHLLIFMDLMYTGNFCPLVTILVPCKIDKTDVHHHRRPF